MQTSERKFRKSIIYTPIPVSPWKGVRLGLNLLFKNSKIRSETFKRKRTNSYIIFSTNFGTLCLIEV